MRTSILWPIRGSQVVNYLGKWRHRFLWGLHSSVSPADSGWSRLKEAGPLGSPALSSTFEWRVCRWLQALSSALKLGKYRLIFMWSAAQYVHINLLFDMNLSANRINFQHWLFDIKIWYYDSGQLWTNWPEIVTWILNLTNNSFLISGVCLLWCWILNLTMGFSLEL